MMTKTHIAAAVVVAAPFVHTNTLLYASIGLIGSVAPDWDFILRLKHRTVTHSLIALFSTTVALLFINKYIALFWCLSYASHLLLDSLTKMGIQLFYPAKKMIGFRLFKTRGAEDYVMALTFIYIISIFFANN